MDENTRIVNINEENISEYPPSCFLNPKNEGYLTKVDWLKERFSEGMKIKLLYLGDEKKSAGFIEYVPGEFAWRAVNASGYMFIHCIYINGNKNKEKGLGTLLIDECFKDAEKAGMAGIAVITSEGTFMAGKSLFLKNGFEQVGESKPSFSLLVRKTSDLPDPSFRNTEDILKEYSGLNIVYSDQCPWVSRSIPELKETAEEHGLAIKTRRISCPEDAQNAPSVYSTFNLVYDGKLLSDHYISKRRFENILKKEVLNKK